MLSRFCCAADTWSHSPSRIFLLFTIAVSGKMAGRHLFLHTPGILRRTARSESCSQAKRLSNIRVCVSKPTVTLLEPCRTIQNNLTTASGQSSCSLYIHIWNAHAALILPPPSFHLTQPIVLSFIFHFTLSFWFLYTLFGFSRAQSQLAQGLKLPDGGVICLSSNQTKLAGKPVYFFLSTGASAHVPRFAKITSFCFISKMKQALRLCGFWQGKEHHARSVHTARRTAQRHTRQGVCAKTSEQSSDSH